MKRSFMILVFAALSASLIGVAPAFAGPGAGVIAAIADVDADQMADLNVYTATGNKAFTYFLSGTSVLSEQTLQSVPSGWTIIGFGDIDGNKAADMVVYDGTTVFAYFLSSTTSGDIFDSRTITTIPSGWDPLDIADVNGDGIADLLIINGQTIFVYFLNVQGAVASSKTLQVVPTNWIVAGFGNVDGENDTDDLMITRTSDNRYFVYYFDDTGSVTGSGLVKDAPGGWDFESLADVDNNGTADLMITNTSNRKVFAYRFSETTPGLTIGQGTLQVYPAGWEVSGFGDIDDNGRADLMVYDSGTRKVYAYLVTGDGVVDSVNSSTLKLLPSGWSPMDWGYGGP